jgi:hypothetical protein
MTRPTPGNASFLPPRPHEDERSGRDEAEIFALKAQGDLFATIRDLVRRVEALENRVNRIFVNGG